MSDLLEKPAFRFNMAAEAAVIGGLIVDNQYALPRIEGVLTVDDFYAPAHREIFKMIIAMTRAGRVADGITLRNAFQKRQTLEEIGGVKYLSELIESAAIGPEISDYARHIRDMARRRSIIDACTKAAKRSADGDEVTEVIAEVHGTLVNIDEKDGQNRQWNDVRMSVAETMTDIANAERSIGLSTGIPKLDQVMGRLRGGNLIVLAGRPSMGKTALMHGLGLNIAAQRLPEGESGGIPDQFNDGAAPFRVVGFFNLEMNREEIAVRTATYELMRHRKVSFAYSMLINAKVNPDELVQFREITPAIGPLQWADAAGHTLAQIEADVRRLHQAHGRLDAVFVDYLQIIQAPRGGAQKRYELLGEITKGLKRIAKQYDIPVITASQVSRQVELRDNKRPQMADLRESGDIEQDADIVAFIYRDEYYLSRDEPERGRDEKTRDKYAQWEAALSESESKVEVIIAKGRMGKTGTAHLFWDAQSSYIASSREEVKPEIEPLVDELF